MSHEEKHGHGHHGKHDADGSFGKNDKGKDEDKEWMDGLSDDE